MSEFKEVSVIKKANVYFGGKVTSRTIQFQDGSKKTLGFMQAGEYEFGTAAPECMEVLSGACQVQLAGQSEWTNYEEGQSFDVPGNSKFKIKIADILDYCCAFIEK
ncbi:MAG: pyrimidine/purine nucleoside phosphorylase [Candidatus Omnitrophica bacterium]|nr:pyrimidine/purine nucleoside phosphorylase [Candidatus Omnitrophota bacterium]